MDVYRFQLVQVQDVRGCVNTVQINWEQIIITLLILYARTNLEDV